MAKQDTWRCMRCGSTCVQVQAWIDPNTNEVFEILGTKAQPPHYAWCADCEDEADLEVGEREA